MVDSSTPGETSTPGDGRGISGDSAAEHDGGGTAIVDASVPPGDAAMAPAQDLLVPPPVDPCSGAMSGNGAYCGGNLTGADANTLYDCQNQATASKMVCPMGCHIAPPGINDSCVQSDPCTGASSGNGAYCGASLAGGDIGTLYNCVNKATASKSSCSMGCHVSPPGQADYCASANTYKLPWCGGVSYSVTQGNNGDICGGTGDHTGVQAYAWDFGLPRHTAVRATRGGTVTVAANVVGPGQRCYDGCTQPFGTAAFWQCCNGCLNTSNHVNVAHGDGTVATYWHMDQVTVASGRAVNAGDVLGYSGTSGCSSGPHLHFMVMGNCPSGYCQSLSISFAEAGKPGCGQNVTSQNACP